MSNRGAWQWTAEHLRYVLCRVNCLHLHVAATPDTGVVSCEHFSRPNPTAGWRIHKPSMSDRVHTSGITSHSLDPPCLEYFKLEADLPP